MNNRLFNYKKRIIFVILLCFLLLFMFTSCDKHKEHTFDQQVTSEKYLSKEATCTEKAEYYYSCSCGKKGTEVFEYGEALGHSFTEYVSNNDAGCTYDGTKTAKCDRCDEVQTVTDEGSATGHNFTKKIIDDKYLAKAATGASPAEYYYACKCGEKGEVTYTYEGESGHSFTEYVSNNDATCTSDGTKTAKCDWCDEEQTIIDKGSKLAHTFDKKIVSEKYFKADANCVHGTQYYYSCVCGECGTETFETSKAGGHKFGLAEITAYPSYEAEGSGVEKCVYCGQESAVTLAKIDSKYISVDYVSISDNAYLDLDVTPNNNSRIIVEFGWNGIENYDSCIYSASGNAGLSSYFEAYVWDHYLDINYGDCKVIPMYANTEESYVIDQNGSTVTASYGDGTVFYNKTTDAVLSACGKLRIGAFSRGTSKVGAGTRYYSLKYYDNNILVYDLLPVLNTQTCQVGFYDVVSGEFLGQTNYEGTFESEHTISFEIIKLPTADEDGIIRYTLDGSTSFDCSIAKIPEVYETLEYLDNKGIGYIDTGIAVGSSDKLEIYYDIQFNSSNAGFSGSNFMCELSYSYINSTDRVSFDGVFEDGIYSYSVNGNTPISCDYSSYVNNYKTKIGFFRLGSYNNTWYEGHYTEPIDAKIYSCYIKQNDNCIAYYVPVREKTSGTEGLYNFITNEFLPLQGTDSKTADYHNWTAETVAVPTASTKGKLKFTCLLCGYSYEQETSTIDTSKYKILDYFESDGRQYIDTDITLNKDSNATLIMDVQFTDYSLYQNWTGANYYLQINANLIGNYNRNTVTAKYGSYTETVFVNGNALDQRNWVNDEPGSRDVFLMALGQDDGTLYTGNGGQLGCVGKLYGAQIISDGELVRNYIPCIRTSDGETGMYDTVTGKFFANVGTSVHQFLDVDIVQEPNARSNGYIRYSCVSCDLSYDVEIPYVDTSKYEIVPYIENAGDGECVDLGWQTSDGMVVDITAMKVGSYAVLVGSHNTTDEAGTYGYQRNILAWASDYWELDYGDCCRFIHYADNYSGEVYNIQYSTLKGNQYVYVNGQEIYSDNNTGQTTSMHNVCLFSNSYISDVYPNSGYVSRIYSVKISDINGTLVRNLVPVVRKSDGEVGFYDAVTKKFYGNSGNGTLIAGGTDSISNYTKQDYLFLEYQDYVDTKNWNEGLWNIDVEMFTDGHIDTCEMGYRPYDYENINIAYSGRCTLNYDTTRSCVKIGINGTNYSVGCSCIPQTSFTIGGIQNYTMGCICKVYGATFSIGGNVVNNYVPVKRNSDGAYGLYDTIMNRFYEVNYIEDEITELIDSDNTTYNPELCETASILAALASKSEMPTWMYTEYLYDYVTGYNDSLSGAEHPDTSDYQLFKRTYSRNGEGYTYYVLSITGTLYDYVWTSNADVGDQADGYHKGFEAAADFVLEGILEEILKDPEHNKILIAGHSRGAAVGAIIAEKLTGSEYFSADNVQCYVFASPTYTTNSNYYPNIFIINNAGDLITELPLKSWGFTHNGVVITLPQDEETMALMNEYIRQLDPLDNITGYIGFTDVSEGVNYLNILVPNKSYATDEMNRTAFADLSQIMMGKSMDTSAAGILTKAMALSGLSGSTEDKINFLTYLINNKDKIGDGHELTTYIAWVKAMNEVHYN